MISQIQKKNYIPEVIVREKEGQERVYSTAYGFVELLEKKRVKNMYIQRLTALSNC